MTLVYKISPSIQRYNCTVIRSFVAVRHSGRLTCELLLVETFVWLNMPKSASANSLPIVIICLCSSPFQLTIKQWPFWVKFSHCLQLFYCRCYSDCVWYASSSAEDCLNSLGSHQPHGSYRKHLVTSRVPGSSSTEPCCAQTAISGNVFEEQRCLLSSPRKLKRRLDTVTSALEISKKRLKVTQQRNCRSANDWSQPLMSSMTCTRKTYCLCRQQRI